MKSEIERFPRLFRAVESVPGLTWPTIVFEKRMTLWLGKLQVEIMQLGRGHTKGDTVVWLPQEQDPVLRRPRRVRRDAVHRRRVSRPTGRPRSMRSRRCSRRSSCPAAAPRCRSPEAVQAGLDGTRAFVTAMFESVKRGARAGQDLRTVYRETYEALKPKFGHWVIFDHCLPFDVTRAYDEATGHAHPRIWTAQRDKEMWEALEG